MSDRNPKPNSKTSHWVKQVVACNLLFVIAFLFVVALLAPTPHCVDAADPSGQVLPLELDFTLPTSDQRKVSLVSDAPYQVICFLGCECPLARIYGPRLQRLSDEYESRGFRFVGVNSNVQDSMDDVRRYVRQHDLRFPIVKDYDRRVAIGLDAKRTPEVFVIDRSGLVLYRGRIDDQYQVGVARAKATTHDLRDAMDQLIDGGRVSNPVTEAVGCLIAVPKDASADYASANLTYCGQIARILQKHCIECHRDGEIGPFSLEDYDEVVGWGDMMIEVIEQGRMPPWHASPEHGSFANARIMSADEKQLIRDWVDIGMPFGDVDAMPPIRKFVDGWRLPREPDAVFEMSDRPFQVPADGVVEYQYFVIDPGFTEDRWVRASQVVPGNRAVVHHCIAFTRPPDGSDVRKFGLLSAYVPGQINPILPEGYALHVQAGSKIVLQMHYTPTGKPESDKTRIGLVFAEPEEVTHEAYVVGGLQQEFEIPPHADNHVVSGRVRGVPKDGVLLSIMPHMHLRGKSFRLAASFSDRTDTLLDVPSYDFNWQHNYTLTSPIPLAEVQSVRFEAVFDNSSNNPSNPDPSEFVTWGDQTWQEMAVVFVSVATPVEKDADSKTVHDTAKSDLRNVRLKIREEKTRKASEFASDYFDRFDRNGDQSITPHELPDSVRLFAFGAFDDNDDGAITIDEIRREAMMRDLER